ncbi:MAG: ArgE/DapE family deacylase [Candidatus Micrarchaeota archaeon]|nr:ArgE/DapE family deacylase [Candidatus Micrarchaeota archaeon]
MVTKKIERARKREVEEIAKLLSGMIQIETVNSGSDDGSRKKDYPKLMEGAKFVSSWMREHGIKSKVEKLDPKSLTPVVTAEIGNGEKTLVINGHIDVVPIGTKAWRYGPFSGKITEGRVFGRGAADMKGGIAVHMYLLSELADKLDYKVVFNAVTDEEEGGFNGSRYLAKRYAKADLALIAEPGGQSAIGIGEKGVLTIKVSAEGKSAHSSRPSLGTNAIMKMSERLDSLSKVSKQELKLPKELIGLTRNSDRLFENEIGRITFNPAVISGGTKANIVPDHCETFVDMRVPAGVSSKKAFAIANELLLRKGAEIVVKSESNYTSPSNGYVRGFKNIVRRNAKSATLIVKSGGSDGRFFREVGVPTIVYGPGEYEQIHTENEHVTFENLRVAYNVYREFMLNFGKM